MIIGHGDVASALVDLPAGRHGRKGWTYFAAGVSNSGETRESEYKREADLLMKQEKSRHIVYFSSLCIFYSDTRYARHKKHMEELIKKNFKHYTIIRMGNITWGKNPHTLINHFKNLIKKQQKIEIWDTHRYLINKEEFSHWINLIPEWNCEMNIPGVRLTIDKIVKQIKSGRL